MSEKVREVIGNIKIPEKFSSGFTFIVMQKGEDRGNIVAVEFGGKKKTDAEKAETVMKRKAINSKVSAYKLAIRKNYMDARKVDSKVRTLKAREDLIKAEDEYKAMLKLSKKEILELVR